MATSSKPASQLLELSADECWALARTQQVGRIAWPASDGLTVIPVNFSVDGRSVHLRTAAYSALARECDDSQVAFQVDHLDPSTRTGWSVLIRGHARIDFRGSTPEDAPDVWPAGSHTLHVTIVAEDVTGRRMGSLG